MSSNLAGHLLTVFSVLDSVEIYKLLEDRLSFCSVIAKYNLALLYYQILAKGGLLLSCVVCRFTLPISII